MAMDGHKASLLVLLDLSAAFDTIDHDTLLQRLEHDYGIHDKALEWLISYLTNRSQSVHINQHKSKVQSLPFGVPQRSVLGPILFVLYTKPLRAIAARHGMEIHFFADDVQLYVSFKCNSMEEATEAKS